MRIAALVLVGTRVSPEVALGGFHSQAGWLAFNALALGTLAEELAFRGYLMRRLQATDFAILPLGRFTWFSFVASSLLFGAMHGRWFAATLAGMLYPLALICRGRILTKAVAFCIRRSYNQQPAYPPMGSSNRQHAWPMNSLPWRTRGPSNPQVGRGNHLCSN